MRRAAQSGFTLIEIVVVTIIIGVMAAAVTLSFGDAQARQSEQYLQRIIALIDLAGEQAVFNARDYGLSFSQHGYHFYEYDDQRWKQISADSMFKQQTLPPTLRHTLYLEGIKVALTDEVKARPQIFITSDGEISLFQLDVFDQKQRLMRLTRDEEGLYSVQPVNS